MSLTCPKCSNPMKSYERNRVLVDQCTGCGGLFLDRGELEQLAAAETAWHASAAPPVAAGPQDAPRYDDRYSRDDDRDRDHDRDRDRDRDRDKDRYKDRYDDRSYGGGYHKPRKKHSSFLSELFD